MTWDDQGIYMHLHEHPTKLLDEQSSKEWSSTLKPLAKHEAAS